MVNSIQSPENLPHSIPGWLEGAMDTKGTKAIQEAVFEAEGRTAGEIVPILVQSSTVNASAPVLAVILAGFIVLAMKHGLWIYEAPAYGNDWQWYIFFAIAILAGLMFGQSRAGQMLLTPRWEKKRQVEQRAMLAFYQAGLNQTSGRTGILLFVSWREHQAVVLADEGVSKHCEPKVFEEVVGELIRGAKEQRLADGFVKAIKQSADILAKHIPLLPGDKNELHDTLRILD